MVIGSPIAILGQAKRRSHVLQWSCRVTLPIQDRAEGQRPLGVVFVEILNGLILYLSSPRRRTARLPVAPSPRLSVGRPCYNRAAGLLCLYKTERKGRGPWGLSIWGRCYPIFFIFIPSQGAPRPGSQITTLSPCYNGATGLLRLYNTARKGCRPLARFCIGVGLTPLFFLCSAKVIHDPVPRSRS